MALSDILESTKIQDTLNSALGALGLSTPTVPRTDEKDGACRATGVTDAGIQRTARIRSLLNYAILSVNTYTALKIAKMQHDLADDYASLAESYRKYYEDNYQPLERELAAEALAEPLYDRKKENLIKGQMMISTKKPFIGKLEKALSCTGRYCTGQRASLINDTLLEQAMAESMACGLAHRYVDEEEITRNTLRWERRNNVLKLGRDIPTEALSYADLATGTLGSIGNQASKAAEGAAWFAGYGGRRLDTIYPENRGPLTIGRYVYKGVEPHQPQAYKIPTIVIPEQPKQEPKITG